MKVIRDNELLKKLMKNIEAKKIFQNDLSKFIEILYFEKDELIYSQGDELKGIYVLASGEIKVYFSLKNGKENILRKLRAPRIFGELEFMVNELAASSVQALKDSYCLYFPNSTCKDILLNDIFFLRKISYNLSEAIYKSNSKSSINQGVSPRNRVIAYIFINEEDNKFFCNMKEMSEYTGISERHLFRIMNEMVQKNYIIKEKNQYSIINREKMKDVIEDFYFED